MADNAKLMAMLSGARNIMNKVESGDYSTGNVDESMMMNDSTQLLESIPAGAGAGYNPNQPQQPQQPQQQPQSNAYSPMKNLATTKMPKEILDLMVNNPMPQVSMGTANQSFDLADVSDLILPNKRSVQETYAPAQQVKPVQQVKQPKVYNSSGQMLITLTEAELDAKINERLLAFMATTFTKTLTENTIKKTITTLIKEGKLKVKSKKQI